VVAHRSACSLDGVTIASGTLFAVGEDNMLTIDHLTVDGALTGESGAGLAFGDAGTCNITNVPGFSTITLADGGANTLTLVATLAHHSGLDAAHLFFVT
jgi:hypothetical protein